MHALKFNGSESTLPARTINLDPIPFAKGLRPAAAGSRAPASTSAPSSSVTDQWMPSTVVRHSAEDAIERTQRRLDNLREALGPDYARSDDGPRAA